MAFRPFSLDSSLYTPTPNQAFRDDKKNFWLAIWPKLVLLTTAHQPTDPLAQRH